MARARWWLVRVTAIVGAALIVGTAACALTGGLTAGRWATWIMVVALVPLGIATSPLAGFAGRTTDARRVVIDATAAKHEQLPQRQIAGISFPDVWVATAGFLVTATIAASVAVGS